MKRKNIILAVLPLILAIFALQSCTKDNTTFTIFTAAVPAGPTPAAGAVVLLSGTSYTLKWEGSAPTWDVYVGTDAAPALAKAGVTGNTYTFTATVGGEYFWYVETKDAHNVVSTSPTWNFYINSAPTAPVLTAPKEAAVNFSMIGALTWTATDPEEDDLTYDVYLGTTSTPAAVATGLTDATFSPTMLPSTKYYWKVIAKDSHGYATSSTVGTFTTGLEAIMTYTGTYNADEPAEEYSYDVTFDKNSATSVKTVNYWNSKWTAIFNIDVVNLTYNMPFTTLATGWTAIESGIIDPKTGTMTGTYTIWQNGKVAEQGAHVYTKK